MWGKSRLTVYVTMALTGLASLLAFLGYATFDRETGLVDLAPFNIYLVAPLIGSVAASALAAVALVLRWGGKQ